MPAVIEKISNNLEFIALEVVSMDIQDIPSLGSILNCLGEMEKDATSIDEPGFSELIQAIKNYLEKIILKETVDVSPLEEGIGSLQTIFRHVCNQTEYDADVSQILNKLECKIIEDEEKEKDEFQPSVENLSDEDRQILSSFVIESLESLETVEVSLMDLEQNPNDAESINSVFRSFHTIKGVSTFLNLMHINKLSHSTENLLDKVREGEIAVHETIIDIILESVDSLKKLIKGVQTGLEKGITLDIDLDITPLVNRIDEIQKMADRLGGKPIGEILMHKGEISPDDLEAGLDKQKTAKNKKIGQILVEENRIDSAQVVSALRDQKLFGHRKMDLQVKVDTKKLDNLVDLTGEMVIAQSMLRQNQAILSNKDQRLAHNLGQLSQITSSLQSTAMSMRMVPIKSTFQKMVRLVRDLSKNSGKEVRLRMSGEDTEIDRNVVDELYEPMIHMIRNSVDHGIETPEERERKGKDRTGEIHLKAYHQGGKIIVEISDDGKGLDKDRIIEKAKANQLLTDESKLTDTEIYNMIFQPGFSTAEQVSDVSGRGVGMDVVKKGIEKLRGRVEINTNPGKGSTFVISLPLTLAIIEGMKVRVGEERYIIPALAILEAFRPSKDQYYTVEGKGEMILSRGNLIPMVRLYQIFNVKGDFVHPWEGLVVSVEHEDQQMGLLLDELLGKEEVVIKNLGDALKDIKGIAGGAIMGDGRVGLILDMAGIWEIVKNG